VRVSGERESECYGDSVSHEMVVASLTCGGQESSTSDSSNLCMKCSVDSPHERRTIRESTNSLKSSKSV
jgi:hypothetical protein